MKIAVKDLEPNPFRRIKSYPIDKEKVRSLKESIHETTFWDNLLARKNGTDKYQIAYGHHRLIALRGLKIKEIDIPVRQLDDAMMIRIMANENIESNRSPAVVNETVHAVKDYLDGELTRSGSWGTLNSSIKGLTDKEHFHQLKDKGVGQTTILKFLGPPWKQHMIQDALATLREDKTKVDRKAVEILPTIEASRNFKAAVKNNNIPVKQQKSLARQIVKEGVGKRDINEHVKQHAEAAGLVVKTKKPKVPPMLDEKIDGIAKNMSRLYGDISAVKNYLENIQSSLTRDQFYTELKALRKLLNEILLPK